MLDTLFVYNLIIDCGLLAVFFFLVTTIYYWLFLSARIRILSSAAEQIYFRLGLYFRLLVVNNNVLDTLFVYNFISEICGLLVEVQVWKCFEMSSNFSLEIMIFKFLNIFYMKLCLEYLILIYKYVFVKLSP